MASRNSSNNTGMRILWIPGRKRNNHKGRLEATKKNIDYSRKQKSSEVWSLGGSKMQKNLLDSDLEPISGPSLSGIIPASCAFGAEAATRNINMLTETGDSKSLDVENQDDNLDKKDKLHCDTSPNEEKELIQYSNDQTLASNNKKSRNYNNNHQSDVNSIESITDNKSKHLNSTEDSPDGSLYTANSKKDIIKKTDDDEDEDKDSRAVDCMYYTLMCCECTIS